MVVLAQFALLTNFVAITGDLTPQREEKDPQTHQTQDHCPAYGGEISNLYLYNNYNS